MGAQPLPDSLLILPGKATAELPDARRVFEHMSEVGDVEGRDWKSGYELAGVHMRAVKKTDRVTAKGNSVLVTIADSDDPDETIDIIECASRLLDGRMALLHAAHMLRAAVIRLESGKAQRLRLDDFFCQGNRGLAGRDAAAVHADFDLDIDVQVALQLRQVFRVIDADADLGPA